jgi:hypothetical protein
MRQRATAAATPPRSADSHDGQWQQSRKGQGEQRTGRRHTHGYQLSLGDLVKDPHAVASRDVYRSNSGEGLMATTIENAAPVLGASEGAARRRRAYNQRQQKDESQLRHGPQHYFNEYSIYNMDTKNNIGDAPHSSSDLPFHHSNSQSDIGGNGATAAADVFYSQYDMHYPHHHDNRPGLYRHNSYSTPNAHKASFQHFETTFHLDPNPLAAVHFRKALHVPDKDYKEFLAGGKGRDMSPVCHPICCANVCAGFSCVGFIFLIFIGILLDTQPLFIQGTLPTALKESDSGKVTTLYFITAERLPTASNAYQASYAYILTMMGCLIFVHYERLNAMVRRRSYQDVPDVATETANSSTAGAVGADGALPYHEGELPVPAYHLSTWNRLVMTASSKTVQLREWAATKALGGPRDVTKRKTRKKTCAKTI